MGVIFIYFSEYYPTWIRASALGGAIALGRTAGIGTTFAAEDMTITLGMWLYGCTGIIAFMASLLLPMDTTNRAMTDTVQYTEIPTDELEMEHIENRSHRSVSVDDVDEEKVSEMVVL